MKRTSSEAESNSGYEGQKIAKISNESSSPTPLLNSSAVSSAAAANNSMMTKCFPMELGILDEICSFSSLDTQCSLYATCTSIRNIMDGDNFLYHYQSRKIAMLMKEACREFTSEVDTRNFFLGICYRLNAEIAILDKEIKENIMIDKNLGSLFCFNVVKTGNSSFTSSIKKLLVAKTLIARNGSSIYYLEKSCFNDREILLSCLRVSDSSDHDFILSQVTDHQLWDDEEVIRAHLSSHPRHVFDEIERRISSNRSLILKMVPEFEVSIYELSEDLWNDKEVVMQVFNAIEYKKLPKHIRNDKEVLLAYIKYKPNEGTKFLNPELVKDLDFLKKVLNYSPNAYKFLTPELKLDRNLIFEIVENNPCLFKFLDSSFRNDRELIMMIVKKYGTDHLDVIPESLRADKELIWSSVEKNADFFNKYPSAITDRELLLHAVKHYPYTLQYADPPLCDDFEVIMTACKNSGMALKFASPRLKLIHPL
ncbi:predicted protein [Naegleria gruberi]|uniref:Predicted protein n=1 Tax=Naegleria gruberi TaxID=5762 RepID=D2W4F8_NAEGR|nr:uncharacterized protein NAEGRDRAFT_76290 [Naegleria gruberi]EFC36045.1 predicted protein [Naegleria gruberi]|eukprot:XP_002668789.1 predicted protein [Naegleria gruberi strain NEG-M]